MERLPVSAVGGTNTSKEVLELYPSGTSNLPTNLRPLPGYSGLNNPSGVAATGTGAQSSFPATTPAPSNQHRGTGPPLTIGRYQTRERLYYESDSAAPPAPPGAKPQSLVARLTDEAPPALSLHDCGTLTPELKYSPKRDKVATLNQSSPMRMEVVDSSSPQVVVMPSEGNWVTVFGFAGAQATAVLEYFKKLGAVEQSELGQGNWMHLRYSTLWAAQKALAKNGTILPVAGTCMIGVLPTQRAMEQVSHAADSFMSPIKNESLRKPSITTETSTDIFIKPGLMAPTVAEKDNNSNLGTIPIEGTLSDALTAETVIPDESIVTKALGFVFGW